MTGVLLTRPEGEAAEASKTRLAAMGWRVVHAPMTRLEDLPPEQAPLPDEAEFARAGALAFSSRNGVEAFARRSAFRGGRVFAVGAATAEAARRAGFACVEAAGGDVVDLGRRIRADLSPDAGPVVHLSGVEAAGDLSGDLRRAGFQARRIALYASFPAQALAPDAAGALERGEIRSILIYAPSAAAALSRLLGSETPTSRLVLAAISRAAAAPLHGFVWSAVRLAARPDEARLLEALGPPG